jgi:hypothetical protein
VNDSFECRLDQTVRLACNVAVLARLTLQTPSVLIPEALKRKASCVKSREAALRGDKLYFSVVKPDASSKFDRESPNHRSEKAIGVHRETVRRPKIFKSDDWYKKAALTMAIRARS